MSGISAEAEPDTGLLPQSTVLHHPPGSNDTKSVAICSVCAAHFLVDNFRSFYFLFLWFHVSFGLIFGEKSLSRPGLFPRVCWLNGEDSGGVPSVPKQAQWCLAKRMRSDEFGSGLYRWAFPKWFQRNGFAQTTRWEKAAGVGRFICAVASVHFTFQLCLVPQTLTWPTAQVTSCLRHIAHLSPLWVRKTGSPLLRQQNLLMP